mgnify:CR=1 FL=1
MKLSTEDGGHLRDPLGARPEAIEAGPDQLLDRARHANLVDRPRHAYLVVAAQQIAFLDEACG